MSNGKNIKFGHDKRAISIVPKDEVDLINNFNGEFLVDEFSNRLITEVDTYFIPDATAKRSTSIVFGTLDSAYSRVSYNTLGIVTATYGNFDVPVTTGISTVGGASPVGYGSTVLTVSSGNVTIVDYPYVDVLVVNDLGGGSRLYFDTAIGIATILGVSVGDFVTGIHVPDGSRVSRINNTRIILTNNTTNSGVQTSKVILQRRIVSSAKSNNTLKIEEQFKETSEVSTTLLGINRAEVQLALFANVSSYGLDPDEFEFYSQTSGTSFGSWDQRENEIYGNRYNATRTEETQESAIKITAFPVPYSYPYGPLFEKFGLYDSNLFDKYKKFIEVGNQLHNYFAGPAGSSYPDSWKKLFLPSTIATGVGNDVSYTAGISTAFKQIDKWTETWRDIADNALIDPVTNSVFSFERITTLLSDSINSTNTRPGYSTGFQRYAYLQSRRVFRYQPGRISGFTFGLRSSVEAKTGVVLEWGISNPTDQYVFQIDQGNLHIIRRSTIPLELSALQRSGLTLADQTLISSGDPFDSRQYWTIKINKDKFNGDTLDGRGKSGYNLRADKVTMYKIEFGWYGAIGARFYAYIPTDNGDARWVVIHTIVIENSLGSPCFQDSYFRFKYAVNVSSTERIRTPQFLYKYGASYYIDGGDEGTSQIYSASSKQKTISGISTRTMIGIYPRDVLYNQIGDAIQNKKLIIPTDLNVSSNSLTEVKIVTCSACPGFGHVYTPGIAKTESGKYLDIQFTSADTFTVVGIGTTLTANDVGAKIIAPSIYNAYISNVNESTQTATIKGFTGVYGFNLGSRILASSNNKVYDRVAGITTTIGIGVTYPHSIRLSQYDCYAASDFNFTGSKIEIQFVNPNSSDGYAHFADFLIGVTDKKPDVSLPYTLNGFIVGAATTTVLPNTDILFGEHTHSYTYANEEGVEFGEGWAPTQPPLRMGIDYRIPSLANPAGGICSKVTVTVKNPQQIQNVSEFNVNPQTGINDGYFYIRAQGISLPPSSIISYDGGQVVVVDQNGNPLITGAKYVGITSTYTSGTNTFTYIRVSQSLGVTSPFTLLIRPVNIFGTGVIDSTKLFNFNPFPLYVVLRLRDYAQINNISIKETIGDFVRTISPKWYTLGNTLEITNAGGNADLLGAAPTNFKDINRQSSALIDVQNQQTLRPSVDRDTLYIGANTTKTINLKKIFGPEKRVITPDNNNLDATFITARKLDGAGTGTVEASINFKEQ